MMDKYYNTMKEDYNTKDDNCEAKTGSSSRDNMLALVVHQCEEHV
jgi:hypothetical protein